MIRSDRGELRVYETPEDLASELAGVFVDSAAAAIAQRGHFCVALAGGTTPKAAYELLAQEPRRSKVDWANVEIYFGDERCVPPDDDRSNYKMARLALLDRVPIPAFNVYRMRGEEDPAAAARAYAQILRERLGDPPKFDLVMLGMGPDAHTASLFPGSDPHADDRHLVRAVYVSKLDAYRLTITPLVINEARRVVVATEGDAKAEALRSVFDEAEDPIARPIQAVRPKNGETIWLVDRAAARLL
jgi:6-phosphogluconolactonase